MSKLIVDNKELFYLDQGKGFTLLFGHIFLWDGTMWQPQIEKLSAAYRCLNPDLWGHGCSALLNSSSYSLEQLADEMWNFLQALAINRFILIGSSVGGMWGVNLALKYPEAVAGLVLIGTYVGAEPEASRKRYLEMIAIAQKTQMIPEPLIEQILPLYFAPATMNYQPELIEQFRQRLSQLKGERLADILTIGRAIFKRKSVLDQLPNIKCPVLVVAGKDDLSRPPSESEEMVAKLENAKLELVPNAGHLTNLEQPEQVNDLLQNFLEII